MDGTAIAVTATDDLVGVVGVGVGRRGGGRFGHKTPFTQISPGC